MMKKSYLDLQTIAIPAVSYLSFLNRKMRNPLIS